MGAPGAISREPFLMTVRLYKEHLNFFRTFTDSKPKNPVHHRNPCDNSDSGFPQALEIMENLENHPKKFHAWKNHGI